MKVVIVGSEGFVGQVLIQHCRAKDIQVIGIDKVFSENYFPTANNPITLWELRHSRIVSSQKYPLTVMDLRSSSIDSAIPQGVDALIHLAAISRDQECRDNPHLAFDINVMGTLNLVRAARARGVRQLIFASSEWVYGEVSNEALQTEDQPIDVTRIQSQYALTKIVAEQSLRLAYQQGLCPVTVLRFGIVYGPRPANWSAVESLFEAVRTQDTVSVGSLATGRRFIHVSDIAEGIISALGREGFEIFNLSGGALTTLHDVIDQSKALLNCRPNVIENSPQNVSIRNPDNRKAQQLLGWQPVVGLKEGLLTL